MVSCDWIYHLFSHTNGCTDEPDKHSDEHNTTKCVSVYYTACKRSLLQLRMTSPDPPGIMFVEFFDEKFLPAMDKYIIIIPARPHCAQVKHLMRNWKLNEFGPNLPFLRCSYCVRNTWPITLSFVYFRVWRKQLLVECIASSSEEAVVRYMYVYYVIIIRLWLQVYLV